MKLKSALNFSHLLLKDTIKQNDTVIDGTAGKGNDTLFLANLVGKKGHVYSFDIQTDAIKTTQNLVNKNNCDLQTKVIHDSHENIEKYIDKPIAAAIFNLGYLPAGDHSIITKGKTTITAIKSSMKLLQKNGLIIIVIYYGHPGGKQEKEQVIDFAKNINQSEYNILQYQFINQIHEPPILLAIQKR